MLKNLKNLTFAFLLLCPAYAHAETTVALTTTVHAGATVEDKTLMQGLLPLLEVAVGEKNDLQVVERQQLDLAMQELILSNPIGKNASLQLGKLATADLILTTKLLESDETGKQHVDVRITESLTGTIRGAVIALVERSTVDETAREISQYLLAVVATPRLAGTSISVAPFESLGRFDRLRPLERGLRDMVVARLRRYKGLRVLQRSEMQQLLTEIDLLRSGLVDRGELPATLPSRAAAYHLRGTLDEQQTEGNQELLVGIELIHAESHQVVEKVAMTTTAEGLTEDLAIEINRLVMSLAKKSNRSFERPSAANKFDEVDQLFRLAVTDLYHFWRRKPRDFSYRDFRLPEFTPSRRTYGGRVKIDSPLGTALIRKSVDRLESVLYIQPERRDAQFALAWCFCCHIEGLWHPERAEKLLRNVFEANRQDLLASEAINLLAEMYYHHEKGRCQKNDRLKAWDNVFFALKYMPDEFRDYEWSRLVELFSNLRGRQPDYERTAKVVRVLVPLVEQDGGKRFSNMTSSVLHMQQSLANAKDHPRLQAEARELLSRWSESKHVPLRIEALEYQARQQLGRGGDHAEAAQLYLQIAELYKAKDGGKNQRAYHNSLIRAARSMLKADMPNEAMALLESFQLTDRSPTSLLNGYYGLELGAALEALGQKDEALKIYVSYAEGNRYLVDNSDVEERIKKLGGVPISPDRDIDVRYVDGEKGKPFYCRSVATDGQRIFVGGDYRPPWSRGVTAYHPDSSRWEKLGGPEVRISCLAYADGYLWAGTDKQGLWRCDLATSQWRQWNTSTDLPDNTVVDVLVHKGAAYVSIGGRNSGGVVRIDADQSVHVYQGAETPRRCLYHLTTDAEKLCGVNKGLFELDLSSDVWHRREDAATGRPVHAMFIQYGPSGLWGSSYGKELFLVGASQEENARFKQAWFPRGLQKAGYSLDFASERDGQVWFGGYPWWRFKSAGLYRFDLETGKFTIYGPQDGFRLGTIYQCYDGVWLGDQLWLATSEGLATVIVRKPPEQD